MTIQAIETVYNGYRFRSRLEARWAVFFDTVGVKYEYECQGYETPAGRYLPDFRLHPQLRGASDPLWVEIKGDRPDEQIYDKLGYVAAGTKTKLMLQSGGPWEETTGHLFYPSVPWKGLSVYVGQAIQQKDWWLIRALERAFPDMSWVDVERLVEQAGGPVNREEVAAQKPVYKMRVAVWMMCNKCDSLFAWPVDTTTEKFDRQCICGGVGVHDHARLTAARLAAQQARFEHGESGAPKALTGTVKASLALVPSPPVPPRKRREPPPLPAKRPPPIFPPAPAPGKYFSRPMPGPVQLDPANPLHQLWSLMLDEVRGRDPKLAAFLRSGLPVAEREGRMVVEFDVLYEIHRKKLDDPRSRAIYEPILGMPCLLVTKEASHV